MRHLIIIIITLFIVGCSSTKKDVSQNSITLDRNVMNNENSFKGWLFYGMALKMWPVELDVHGDTDLYKREVFARSKVALIWQELRQKNSVTPDTDLDALVSVYDAGYMREYVWIYIHKSNSGIPNDLKLDKFEQWMAINLPKHEAIIEPGVTVPVSS